MNRSEWYTVPKGIQIRKASRSVRCTDQKGVQIRKVYRSERCTDNKDQKRVQIRKVYRSERCTDQKGTDQKRVQIRKVYRFERCIDQKGIQIRKVYRSERCTDQNDQKCTLQKLVQIGILYCRPKCNVSYTTKTMIGKQKVEIILVNIPSASLHMVKSYLFPAGNSIWFVPQVVTKDSEVASLISD